MMLRLTLAAIALLVLALTDSAAAQDTSLLTRAKVTRNESGEIISVRLTGKSNRDRENVTPEIIEAIASLDDLEYLSLWGTTVVDDDIKRLSHLKKLQLVDLTFTDVTGGSLQTLSQLPALVSLRLEGCNVRSVELEWDYAPLLTLLGQVNYPPSYPTTLHTR